VNFLGTFCFLRLHSVQEVDVRCRGRWEDDPMLSWLEQFVYESFDGSGLKIRIEEHLLKFETIDTRA